MAELPEHVLRAIREVVAPLVELDGGILYLVPRATSPTATAVRLHLAGNCGGCPGVAITTREVIEPALRAVGVRDIEVSAGWNIPEGAQRVAVDPSLLPEPEPNPLRSSRTRIG